MKPRQRRGYSAELKAKVALEAIRGQKTINQIASEHDVHPDQVGTWKKQALESLPEVFSGGPALGGARSKEDEQAKVDALHQQIGQLQVELAFLKKRPGVSSEDLRNLVEPSHPDISILRQCELLGLPRSSYYYQPEGESPLNLTLMPF